MIDLLADQNPLNSIHAFGVGLQQAQIDLPTSFTVDAHAELNSNEDIKVVVTSKIHLYKIKKIFSFYLAPSKHTCPIEIIDNHDRTWTINYIPREVGETYIDIFLGDQLVNGSPFKVNVFDIHQIHVSNILDGLVGHLVKFDIDASNAGVGQLEIIIQDGQIPCHATSYGAFQFDAAFLPCEPGRYTIEVKFNGLSIPGSNIKIQ